MANTPKGILRTIGLVVAILAVSASSIIDFTQGHNVWGWAKFGIVLLIISLEIYMYLRNRITISTDYKQYIKEPGFWGELSLFLFGLSLTGVILHLAVW